MTDRTTDELARVLWEYMRMRHEPAPCDLILVLGSNDTRVAEHGARLFLQGLAPRILFSGNAGRLTRHLFDRPEAEVFADIARQMGVPEDAILREDRSANTGENIAFSRALLAARGLDPARFIVVQKPYMERRAYASFMKQWPGKDIRMASPPLDWDSYPNEQLSQEVILPLLVGDVQRMRLYAEKGFQIPQPIPAEVWAAYEELVRRGHTRHLA